MVKQIRFGIISSSPRAANQEQHKGRVLERIKQSFANLLLLRVAGRMSRALFLSVSVGVKHSTILISPCHCCLKGHYFPCLKELWRRSDSITAASEVIMYSENNDSSKRSFDLTLAL